MSLKKPHELTEAFLACRNAMSTPCKILRIIGTLVALIILISQIRNPKARSFPNNTVVTICFTAAVLGFAFLINIITNEKHLIDDVNWHSLCLTQAGLFQFFVTCMVYNWIFTCIILYALIVREMPMKTIQEYKYWYYVCLICISSGTTIFGLVENIFGHFKEAMICYIPKAETRFRFLYWHMIFGMFIFCLTIPRVLRKLWKAKTVINNKDRVDLFRNVIHQHILYAGYVLFLFIGFVLYGFNNLFLEKDKIKALNSTYIMKSTLPYCILTAFNISSLMWIAPILFGLSHYHRKKTKKWTLQILKRLKLIKNKVIHINNNIKTKLLNNIQLSNLYKNRNNNKHPSQNQSQSHRQSQMKTGYYLYNNDKKNNVSKTSGSSSNDKLKSLNKQLIRNNLNNDTIIHISQEKDSLSNNYCRSAYDSECKTANSIPMDQYTKKIHDLASQACTSILLQYVCEELENDNIIVNKQDLESLISEYDHSTKYNHTFITTLEGEEIDLDTRLALARERYYRERQMEKSNYSSI